MGSIQHTVPTTMRAYKVQGPGVVAVSDTPVPALREDHILIKTKAVALNPADWKFLGFDDKPTTIGFDYAGEVMAVGSKVSKSWKVGDRVFGCLNGNNPSDPEVGAFAEYAIGRAELQLRAPDTMTYEELASMLSGILTVAISLYDQLGIPLPVQTTEKRGAILIYGGSSATGILAIQYAKLSGFVVHTTCSPRNFDLVKSYGADYVYDYKKPNVGAEIRAETGNELQYAFDIISQGSSTKICFEAFSDRKADGSKKPQYCQLGQVREFPRDDIEVHSTLGLLAFGEAFEKFGKRFEADMEKYELYKKVIGETEKLLQEGKLRPTQVELRNGGLDGISAGLEDLKQGKVSGKKLVYSLA